MEELKTRLDDPRSVVFVYSAGQDACGFLAAIPFPEKEFVYIHELQVKASARGHAIAYFLLDAVTRKFPNQLYYGVVHKASAGIDIYTKAGAEIGTSWHPEAHTRFRKEDGWMGVEFKKLHVAAAERGVSGQIMPWAQPEPIKNADELAIEESHFDGIERQYKGTGEKKEKKTPLQRSGDMPWHTHQLPVAAPSASKKSEKWTGTPQFLPVSFFDKGKLRAAAVCKVPPSTPVPLPPTTDPRHR